MSRVYIVLGTGRSATSYITQCIHDSGSNMYQDVNKHAEDWDFKKLNQRILKAAGGNAYNPPTQDSIHAVEDQFKAEIGRLIASRREKYSQWGWKDPRTVFTLDLYKPHLKNDDVYYIYSLRDFEKVKQSFERLAWADRNTTNRFLKKHRQRLKEIIDTL